MGSDLNSFFLGIKREHQDAWLAAFEYVLKLPLEECERVTEVRAPVRMSNLYNLDDPKPPEQEPLTIHTTKLVKFAGFLLQEQQLKNAALTSHHRAEREARKMMQEEMADTPALIKKLAETNESLLKEVEGLKLLLDMERHRNDDKMF